jgi:hypothetical protein
MYFRTLVAADETMLPMARELSQEGLGIGEKVLAVLLDSETMRSMGYSTWYTGGMDFED